MNKNWLETPIIFAGKADWWIGLIIVLLIGFVCWRAYYFYKTLQTLGLVYKKNRKIIHNMYVSRAKIIIRCFLYSIALLGIFLVVLRPTWNKKEEIIKQEGRDVIIAIDISRSMLVTDMNPDRLSFVKAKIKQLLSLLEHERVGLILFSGTAFVQCPLTTDIAAFTMFLDQIDVETISSGTTALDQAILKALHVFSSSNTEQKKTKLLLLCTDGEDFSRGLTAVKEQAVRAGLSIFTLGVGTAEGGPVPLFDEHGKRQGHQKDQQGSIVISRLNESLLQSVSREAGGLYLRAVPDTSDIQKIVQRVRQFEKEAFDDARMSHLEEQYRWCALVSFIAYCIAWII